MVRKTSIHSFTGDRKKNYTNHLTDQHPSMLCFYEYLREANFYGHSILTDQHPSMLCFYEYLREANFYGHSILTESVFVTQMSSYVRISV